MATHSRGNESQEGFTVDKAKAFALTAVTIIGVLAVLKLGAKYVGPVGKVRDFILK